MIASRTHLKPHRPSRTDRSSAKPLQHPLAVRYVPVESLRLDPLNPRAHSDKQVQQIANSIRSFGFNVPILIDESRKVIAGHGRVLAAELLEINEVPTVLLAHLSPDQRRAFAIADNRLTETSYWNEVLLGEQLKALAEVELDFDLAATGFEMGEIDLLIEGLTPCDRGHDPADNVPEIPTFTVTKVGDCWTLGTHRVLCDNALDSVSHARLMDDRLASVVFTDPPFNVPIDGHASGLGRKHHRDFAMACGEMSREEFTDFLRKVCVSTSLSWLGRRSILRARGRSRTLAPTTPAAPMTPS